EVRNPVVGQVALALQKAALIARLAEENSVRDLFSALAEGAADVAEARARAAGWDIARPHVFVEVRPLEGTVGDEKPWPGRAERVESQLRRLAPGTLCDSGRRQLRALLPLHPAHGAPALAALAEAPGQPGQTAGAGD